MYSESIDYTGFRVVSRKPIAVYGGCDCVNITDNIRECDHIMEQVCNSVQHDKFQLCVAPEQLTHRISFLSSRLATYCSSYV